MSALHTRELRLDASIKDLPTDALIPATIATSSPVERFGMLEVLDCSPTGVDLSRAPLPLITAHDTSELAIGVVEQLQADGARVTGLVRFATSPEAQQVRADVIAGIHRSLSVGYAQLDQGTPVEGGFVYRWRPHEVSIVSIPADPSAGFFRSHPGVTKMNAPVIHTSEAAAIVDLCHRHGVDSMASGFITRSLSIDQARAAILEELARRDEVQGGHINVMRMSTGSTVERDLIVNTLVARMGGRPKGDVIGATDCTGLAVRALELAGERISYGDSRDRILQRAMHGTSDFPQLLGAAVGRVLHDAYAEAPAALKLVSRLTNLPDFREKSVVRLGGAPSLEKVNEHGEFKYGTVNEAANTWRLATYGRIISLARQALVNDDLSGFAGLLVKFGQSAARREADELVASLIAAPLIDGLALFHANRSNLIDGKLSVAGLGAAVSALRAQKDIDGGFVSQEPGTLVVPAGLEMTARQLVATFTPSTPSNVQPFSLNVVVEPRLDANSATAWYLVAGNQSAFEHGYLAGAEGVQIDQREGFEVDGLEIKARLDFGCGWASPVGWVKSTGTV